MGVTDQLLAIGERSALGVSTGSFPFPPAELRTVVACMDPRPDVREERRSLGLKPSCHPKRFASSTSTAMARVPAEPAVSGEEFDDRCC